MSNSVLESLLDGLDDNIQLIQSGFDNYQKKCFSERPSEFFCLELNGEAGELANLEKKIWKGRAVDFDRFEDEAADVFIALMNYCNAKGINLGKAIFDKLIKIESLRSELESVGKMY